MGKVEIDDLWKSYFLITWTKANWSMLKNKRDKIETV